MARLHLNFRHGTINDVDDVSTTLTSLGFVGLPEIIDGVDVLALTIDPGGLAPEIVWVTAHDSAATEVTVLRGREGTTAAAHAAPNTTWRHAITALDLAPVDIPDPPEGLDTIYVYDADDEEYVLVGGRTFIGPVDPATAGITPVDGDQWKDTSA